MGSNSDRNYRIAAAALGGRTLADISSEFGLSLSYICTIASRNAWLVRRRADRPVPRGLTVRAAIAIEDAIGIWPNEEDKSIVQIRAMDIMRSPSGRRVVMAEIGSWLYENYLEPAATCPGEKKARNQNDAG